MKTCSKCGATDGFGKNRSRTDGLQQWCRSCLKAYRDTETNKRRRNDYAQNYRILHRAEAAIRNREYNSRPQNAQRRRGLAVVRRLEDVEFRLGLNLRTRLHQAIKRNSKAGSAVRDLGCTGPELRAHLEAQFKPGMTWENWSRNGWHIDHIRPLSKFDLTAREQFVKACHYTNLQPLWAEENLKKGAASWP